MDILEVLKNVEKCHNKILCASEWLEQCKAMAAPHAPSSNIVKVQTSSKKDLLETAAIRINEAEERLANCIDDYMIAIKHVHEIIDDLEATDMLIFHYKYICLMSWKEIADKTGYSYKWVNHRHSQVLKRLMKENQKNRENQQHIT